MTYPTQKDTINSGKNAAAFSGEKKKEGRKEEFMLKGEVWRADPADPAYESDSKETSWSTPEL